MDKVNITEPSYKELTCWCKINIEQLLKIGYGDSDEHIEKHFGGEIGLLNVIDGYIQTLKNLIDISTEEGKLRKSDSKKVHIPVVAD